MRLANGNRVHRQQLFNWVGRDIGLKRPTSDADRQKYVDRLRETLQSGLWLQIPPADKALHGSLLVPCRAMVCFTEWSLGDSIEHARKYGRMAFGFWKQFVINHGGQPVTYYNDQRRKAWYKDAVETMRDFVAVHADDPNLGGHFVEFQKCLDYVLHFHKPMKPPPKKRPRKPESLQTREPNLPAIAEAAGRMAMRRNRDPAKRPDGSALKYMEEREWRAVYTEKNPAFKANPTGHGPPFRLQFKIGKDLRTVVLPDSGTVGMAMADKEIRTELYPPGNAPHVTLLSFDDIGTF